MAFGVLVQYVLAALILMGTGAYLWEQLTGKADKEDENEI